MSKQPHTYLRILNKLNTMRQSAEVLKTIESLQLYLATVIEHMTNDEFQ